MSFVLAVGDVFHVEGNDIFCMASQNCISCPEDMETDSHQTKKTMHLCDNLNTIWVHGGYVKVK